LSLLLLLLLFACDTSPTPNQTLLSQAASLPLQLIIEVIDLDHH
jgi:hypothetical protein